MTQYDRSLNYDVGDGTSMASPIVAAVAALVWSKGTANDNAAVRARVECTADKVMPGTGTFWAYGRVNAGRAVDAEPCPLR
jgi:thermitase